MVLKGICKVKGKSVVRKLPIDPVLLLRVKSLLNFSSSIDIVFWAVCLTMFFGLLRKSNVLPPSINGYNPSKHLSRADIKIHPCGLHHGVILILRWTKARQYKDKILHIPLPFLPRHPLCPTTAVVRALALCPCSPLDRPAFLVPSTAGIPPSPLLYGSFLTKLRSLLASCDLDPSRFAGHSFRRGGASWGLIQGLPTEVIRLMGDWRSMAYTAYLDMPLTARTKAIYQFSHHLPTAV